MTKGSVTKLALDSAPIPAAWYEVSFSQSPMQKTAGYVNPAEFPLGKIKGFKEWMLKESILPWLLHLRNQSSKLAWNQLTVIPIAVKTIPY